MAKRETGAQRPATPIKRAKRRQTDRDMKGQEEPVPRIYGDPFQEGIGLPAPNLQGESMDEVASLGLGYFQELAARVKQRCSNKKLSNLEKKLDCFLLIYMVGEATSLVHSLALECELPFREVAEGLNQIPWMFPAHPGELQRIQKMLWNNFNLGKRNALKLRPAPGRKTFSFETWANQLLFHYVCQVYYKFAVIAAKKSAPDFETVWLVEIQVTPETARQLELLFEEAFPPTPKKNAKQWLDVIWQLLLLDIPEPETHPRLRQLGGRPSKVHDVRATIKAKLGTYLDRMLNDQAVHK
jgi:hypothetical protein